MVAAGIDGNVVVVVEDGNRNLLVAALVLVLEGNNRDVVVMLVKVRNNSRSDEKTDVPKRR